VGQILKSERVLNPVYKKIRVFFSFAVQNSYASADEIKVFLNGVKNGRTMVPFIGVDISWNGVNRTIFAYVNGYKVNLDAEAEIVGGRTFVPLRFVSENAGADVSWDGARRTVYISYVNQVRDLGEKSYFRDLEFTVDGWESEADGKILKEK